MNFNKIKKVLRGNEFGRTRIHSEIRDLFSTVPPREMLQNLPYFLNTNILYNFFCLSFYATKCGPSEPSRAFIREKLKFSYSKIMVLKAFALLCLRI